MRPTISDETIKLIKELPFTAILETEGIHYKKTGREAATLCPWHDDSNPSLTVNDDKGFCYCFVCQVGDDAIGFLKQKLGVSFQEAIERIAEKNNIPIQYENIDPELAARQARRRAETLAALKDELESYRSLLRDPRATRIRDSLDSRNILPSTSRFFELGYCKSGFFEDRITIPIHDHRGNLIGFTGRATRDDIKPKYKNSENSDHFDKSKIVFNEHRAVDHSRETGSLVFVEGHFDVISMWQYGIKNVVAMQGTAAPTEATLNRLLKRAKKMILCFDADQGGSKAIEQFIKVAGPMACRGQVNIAIAVLPPGTDPDQCIRENLVDMYSVLEDAKPWLDWQLEFWLAGIDRTDTAFFTNVEKNVRKLVESIQSPVLRQYYVDKASRMLALDAKAASKIAKSWAEQLPSVNINKKWSKPSPQQTRRQAEKSLLRLYINVPELREECRPFMSKLHSSNHNWLWGRIVELEQYADPKDLKHCLMAVLSVAEPHYMNRLRSTVEPGIKVLSNPDIMKHISNTLSQELTTNER